MVTLKGQLIYRNPIGRKEGWIHAAESTYLDEMSV